MYIARIKECGYMAIVRDDIIVTTSEERLALRFRSREEATIVAKQHNIKIDIKEV